MKRLEFSKKVKIEIFRRAGGPGNPCCEGCGLSLRNKPFEVDHTLECWEMEDVQNGLRAPLTAEDGKLLGRCCHAPKTARKAGERAHVKRIVEKQAKASAKRSSFQTNRDGRFKRKMSGEIVER